MPQTPEARLAYLGFKLIPPGQLLRPYIRSYWYFRRETPLETYHEEFMHPTGGFGIVFNFGDPLHLDAQVIAEPVFLDGTNTVSRKLGFGSRVELMGVRFYEGGAYPFLAVPLNELRNEMSLGDALDRSGLLAFHARLYEAKSLAVRINLLEAWLMDRLSLGKERHEIVPVSLAMLRKADSYGSIPGLARNWLSVKDS